MTLQVESRNRFMSLCSRLVKLPRQLRAHKAEAIQTQKISNQCRNELQNYFVETMKLQNADNSNDDQEQPSPKSEEELVWQNEFKGYLNENSAILFDSYNSL